MADPIAYARGLTRDPNASAQDLKAALEGILNILDAVMEWNSDLEWTPKERAAIDALMERQELSEHQVLKMGIKWYQIIVLMGEEGYPVVRFQTRDGKLRPNGPYAGNPGD